MTRKILLINITEGRNLIHYLFNIFIEDVLQYTTQEIYTHQLLVK
jgi:hypothetical protein